MNADATSASADKKEDKKLNDLVAVTVVILTVFLAVSKIKDDNIVQAMQKAQMTSVDAWAEYQFARVKLHVDENGLATLRLLESAGNVDKALAAKQTAEYEADIKKYQARLGWRSALLDLPGSRYGRNGWQHCSARERAMRGAKGSILRLVPKNRIVTFASHAMLGISIQSQTRNLVAVAVRSG